MPTAATDDRATDAPEGDEPDPADLTVRSPRLLVDGPRRRQLAAVLALALALAIATCAWLAATRDEPVDARSAAAAERDAARHDTAQALETLLSADHLDAAATLDGWSGVTTGRLHSRLVEQRSAVLRQIRRNKEATDAKVVESGLASWDSKAGTARLLAVLELTAKKAKATTTVVRYLAMAQRVDGQWRLSAVQQMGDDS